MKIEQRTVLVDINVKKVRENAILPCYAHGTEDSGLDLFASAFKVKENGSLVLKEDIESYTIKPQETVIVQSGVACEIPRGTELQVRPTSGNSLKTTLRLPNSPGTIDSGFRDEIGIIIYNTGNEPITIKIGDKVAQMVLMPVLHANINVVDELKDSERGTDGYGSTGMISGAEENTEEPKMVCKGNICTLPTRNELKADFKEVDNLEDLLK